MSSRGFFLTLIPSMQPLDCEVKVEYWHAERKVTRFSKQLLEITKDNHNNIVLLIPPKTRKPYQYKVLTFLFTSHIPASRQHTRRDCTQNCWRKTDISFDTARYLRVHWESKPRTAERLGNCFESHQNQSKIWYVNNAAELTKLDIEEYFELQQQKADDNM